MSKKKKALQISALLTAVSGAALLVPASSSPANAAEIRTIDDRCWDRKSMTPREYRLHNCDYIQYGLTPPSDSPDKPASPGNGADTGPGSGEGGSGGPDAGGGGGGVPVDPYTS